MTKKRYLLIFIPLIVIGLVAISLAFSEGHFNLTSFAIFGVQQSSEVTLLFKDLNTDAPISGVNYALYASYDPPEINDSGLEPGSSLQITISEPVYGYFHKEYGCYYPRAETINPLPVPYDFPIRFRKYNQDCISRVISIENSGTKINNPITITTDIQSVFSRELSDITSFAPPDFVTAGYYDSEIKVKLLVNGTEEDSETLNITIDETAEVELFFTPTLTGEHNITIVTEPVDCQCETIQLNSSSITINVEDFDVDGDGFNDTAYGGDDCDDEDDNIWPGGVEICNGKDDNCDGDTDENLTRPCEDYTAGVCADSYQECRSGKWRTCEAKTEEICNNLNDDCDTYTDESITAKCYSGPSATKNVGICKEGQQICTAGEWGECSGEILPADFEICENNLDDNCDGNTDELGCQYPEQDLPPTPTPTPTPPPPDPFCGDKNIDPGETCLNCNDAICLTDESCELGECVKSKDYSWAILILLIILISIIAILIYYQMKGEGDYKIPIYILAIILIIIGGFYIYSNLSTLPTFTPSDSNATIILENSINTRISALYSSNPNFQACLTGTYKKQRYQISGIEEGEACSKYTLGKIQGATSCIISPEEISNQIFSKEFSTYRVYARMCSPTEIAFYSAKNPDKQLFYITREVEEKKKETTFEQAVSLIQNLFSIILAIAAIAGMYFAHKHKKKAPAVEVTDIEHRILDLLKTNNGMKPTELQDELNISIEDLTNTLRKLIRKNLIFIEGTMIYLKHEIEKE